MANTVLDDISTVIGFSATQRLAVWYGDMNLYIPTLVVEAQDRADHALVVIVGEQAYRALVREFGGHTLWIPHATSEADKTRKRIADLTLAGNKDSVIADLMGLSYRRIQQVKAELREAGFLALLAKRGLEERAREKRGGKAPQEMPLENATQETPAATAKALAAVAAGLGSLTDAKAPGVDLANVLGAWRGSR